MDTKMKLFVESNISNDFGLSISEVANHSKNHGRFSAWLNSNVSDIIQVLTIVKDAGVSPAFFAAYEKTEGYNSKWGWLNHTSIKGTPTQDAQSVSNWIVTQSKNMTDNPAWIDYANYKDFVPQSVKDEGNAHYQNLPSGTIGRVTIAGTAAATWEVYFPNGLKKEYNGIQDYGAPLTNMMNTIESWGGTIDGSPNVPDDPDDPDYPDDTPGGLDVASFVKELNQVIQDMLTKDIFKVGNSEFSQNGFIQLISQMENTHKIKPNQKFYDTISNKFNEFNDSYIPEPDDDEEPVDPEPIEYEKIFPVRLGNGINFFKRNNWGVGTLQRNMTHGVRSSGANHYGYDIGGGGVNHTIYSVTNGKVIGARYGNGIGYKVTIENDDDQYFIQYGHLKSFLVEVGDVVTAGQPIGIMGASGGNYAIHLDIRIGTNPDDFFLSWDTTIDPEHYLEVDKDNSTTLPLP